MASGQGQELSLILRVKEEGAELVKKLQGNIQGLEGDLVSGATAHAKAESAFNARAVGDSGASVGLFQLHERGQGAGMSVAERSDPLVNARKFLGAHGELFQQLKASGLAGEELAATFGRIAEVSDPQFAYRYADAYRELVAPFDHARRGRCLRETAYSLRLRLNY